MCDTEMVKENVSWRAPLSAWWAVAALAATAAALGVVELIDRTLPAPLHADTAPPDRFIAGIAHDHLVNLTSIGPRVAGSYENEVLAVGVLVEAVKRIARAASPHNRVELDLHSGSGIFPLTFFDGMTNAYRDVQAVLARVSGVGAAPGARRTALLLNCHFDTVPDSPGASDDGAGCAVLLETLRALAATPHPLRHDAIFLFNGAEENIMQASHAFITTHKWARSVRAFVNVDACGAGGREVLFQAGPHDPWIMEVYAGVVPHPFASSLAQELFESGLIPGDTDFRVFRDHGNLSGVDLAWSSNGYVYHTRLDTADSVPPAALQHTGDNVLALTRGLLASSGLESAVEPGSRQPVFFDVLGRCVLSARGPLAAGLALAVLALVPLRLHLGARAAAKRMYMRRSEWWRAVGGALLAGAAGAGGGVLAAAGVGAALHVAGARLAFYSRGWLLAPLYAVPALAGAGAAAGAVWRRRRGALRGRGWGAARAWADAAALGWALLLALCVARQVRSGFLPLLWVLLPTALDLAATLARQEEGARAWWWAAGSAVPVLQTWYLAMGSFKMFVPLMGRAGTPPVPPDVIMSILISTMVLAACSWMMPLIVVIRNPKKLLAWGAALCAAGCALALSPLGAPYSAAHPQRFMLFHTRRTLHTHSHTRASEEHFYWLPELDSNSPHSVDKYVPEMARARRGGGAECARWLYCGAPYFLPVLGFIARGHVLPADSAAPPRARAAAHLAASPLADTLHLITLNITGPQHVVVIVSPVEGARVELVHVEGVGSAAPQEGRRWGARRTYFLTLHAARPRRAPWLLQLHVRHSFAGPVSHWADVSVAGHAMFGADSVTSSHRALLDRFPPWAAATGWGVDLHLYTV